MSTISNKYKITIFAIVLAVIIGFLILTSLGDSLRSNDEAPQGTEKISSQGEDVYKCGIEQCHGMELTCGKSVPEACDDIYLLGDNCRQFFDCNQREDSCVVGDLTKFNACWVCVEDCKKKYPDGFGVFECEGDCFEELAN